MYYICIGGDKRHFYMKKALLNAGWTEKLFIAGDPETFSGCDILILPIPSFVADGTVRTVGDTGLTSQSLLNFKVLPKIIIGGMLPQKFVQQCENICVKAISITERNDYAILNAVPTAEAAIMIALEELPASLWEMDVLVTGYGRVSQVLCDRLTALGAHVTVAARKEGDRAYARTRGADSANIYSIDEIMPEKYRLVYNTVPNKVISREIISRMRSDALVVDLASIPGGCDTSALEQCGIKFIHALSLPGRNAPETAGNILAQVVLKIAQEEEIT